MVMEPADDGEEDRESRVVAMIPAEEGSFIQWREHTWEVLAWVVTDDGVVTPYGVRDGAMQPLSGRVLSRDRVLHRRRVGEGTADGVQDARASS